jgi:tetratricopeptide (TPR) repeat protein
LRLFLAAIFFSVLALIGRPAAADEAAASRARELRERGNEAMQSGRPEDALRLYREAHALVPDPALHYNEGRALQALARYPEALDALERFDKEASLALKEKVGRLTGLMDEVRAKVATVRIACDVNGASVRLGDRRLGLTPLAPVRVNAGRALLEVSAEGYKLYTEEVALAGGVESTLRVPLVAASPPPARRPEAPPAPRSATSYTWLWITGAVAVVAATVAIVAATQIERGPDQGTIPPGSIGAGLRF